MIANLLRAMTQYGASDLIIKAGSPPLFRIYGELKRIKAPSVTAEVANQAVRSILKPEQWDSFQKDLELDAAFTIPQVGRFRLNVFKQRNTPGMVLRLIPAQIPTPEQLGLPPICKDLALRPRGLLLVTGPAGCGKSTTQASLIDLRNSHEACHIMTVEDPVEFVHHSKKALVNQRQLHRDTHSFANALKYVLRQDPDIILIGEMRDLETISLAITAAETGHLVIGTLHTTNAIQTIDRIIDVFPHFQQQQVRMQISVNLIGVISQQLLTRADRKGRIAAFEILIANIAVRNLIREGKSYQLHSILQTKLDEGMRTMNYSLLEMLRKNLVTIKEAAARSTNPQELITLSKSTTPPPQKPPSR